MDAEFWHKKWEKNELGFHENKTNALLVENFSILSMHRSGRIFLPLCGKSLDIAWLLAQGYHVLGCELSHVAIEQLFTSLKIKPTRVKFNYIERFSAEHIDIYVGDIFKLSSADIGNVDAVYDRAALVALPEHIRNNYVPHVIELTRSAPQLLISYEYDQHVMNGPPFSVSNGEVRNRYQADYQLSLLRSISVPGGLRGKCAATENVWHLSSKLS